MRICCGSISPKTPGWIQAFKKIYIKPLDHRLRGLYTDHINQAKRVSEMIKQLKAKVKVSVNGQTLDKIVTYPLVGEKQCTQAYAEKKAAEFIPENIKRMAPAHLYNSIDVQILSVEVV